MKFLKKIFSLLFTVASERCMINRRVIETFDLVSMIKDPNPSEVYMVYSMDNQDTYLINWRKYFTEGTFDSGGDKILVYDNITASENLYKVDNISVSGYDILMHSSVRELTCYATRMMQTFARHHPLLGMFEDKKDGHMMLVVELIGDIATGHAIIADLTIIPVYGILHNDPPMHTVRTAHILNNYTILPINIEILVSLLKIGPKPQIAPLVDLMFRAIKSTERRELSCGLHGIATTGCVRPDAPPPIKETKKEITV